MPNVSIPRETLERLLSEHLSSESRSDAAVRHHVLPLMDDFMGCWALTMSGELAFVLHEEPDAIELVRDHAVEAIGTNVALAQGSRRYAALASIRPRRPSDATPCTSCDGSGHIPDTPDNIICACGGLGWLPPERGAA